MRILGGSRPGGSTAGPASPVPASGAAQWPKGTGFVDPAGWKWGRGSAAIPVAAVGTAPADLDQTGGARPPHHRNRRTGARVPERRRAVAHSWSRRREVWELTRPTGDHWNVATGGTLPTRGSPSASMIMSGGARPRATMGRRLPSHASGLPPSPPFFHRDSPGTAKDRLPFPHVDVVQTVAETEQRSHGAGGLGQRQDEQPSPPLESWPFMPRPSKTPVPTGPCSSDRTVLPGAAMTGCTRGSGRWTTLALPWRSLGERQQPSQGKGPACRWWPTAHNGGQTGCWGVLWAVGVLRHRGRVKAQTLVACGRQSAQRSSAAATVRFPAEGQRSPNSSSTSPSSSGAGR